MALGQPAGRDASGRRVNDLLTLLHEAGHTDFRDARGPMGFTQRQANGKFTASEVEEFIQQLEQAQHEGRLHDTRVVTTKLSAAEQALRDYPDAQLAAELQRRGWIVVEP